MNGMPHTANRVFRLHAGIRELLQISNHGQQNQRGCLLSTGPLYYLYLHKSNPAML